LGYSFYFDVLPVVAAVGFLIIIVFQFCGLADWIRMCAPGEVLITCVALYFAVKRSNNIRSSFSRFAKLYLPSGSGQVPFVDIDDSGISFSVPGLFEGRYRWDAVFAVAEDERIALLHMKGKRSMLIPIHELSPGQRLELSEIVKRNVTRKTL
jgi:hypothetical protein